MLFKFPEEKPFIIFSYAILAPFINSVLAFSSKFFSFIFSSFFFNGNALGKFDERVDFNFVKVRHGNVKSMAYIFENTAYISDCNDLSIIKNNKLKNLKYLIIDCLKIKNNFAHFNLKESIYVHNQLKPKKTILTNLHADLDYNFLRKSLPKNIIPAHDKMILKI